MKCDDLLQALNRYVDGEIDAAICEEFRDHLAACNPCKIVVDNVRHTITLYKAGKPFELPVAFRDKLHRTLEARWKAQYGGSAPPIPGATPPPPPAPPGPAARPSA